MRRVRDDLAVLILVLLAFGGTSVARARAGEAFHPQFKPALQVSRAAGAIEIDGDLEDPGWKGAARADGFTEVSPGDQVRPPVESAALVTYDDKNLYVALIAHDDPRAVRVSLRERDQIFSDDYFGLMLDTYGDHAWGYELFVNPLGIQGDLRMAGNGEEDVAFDIIWESRGKVTSAGYQVELAIPFASLRFPDKAEQTWRMNFWRDHQREVRRRYAWAATDRDDPCFMCQWGAVAGIRDIHPKRSLDVIASLVGQQAGALRDPGGLGSPFKDTRPRGEAGLNLRYGITSNSSAELAFNPDFSQVESDPGQIDVNQPFALFFQERRPFFQEGAEMYNTWIQAVYTRSINNPAAAAKLTGRFDRTSLAYTFARDEDSPLLVPLQERTHFFQGGHSVVHIFRVKQTFGQDSYIGGLVTDRRLTGGGAGTALGIDSRVRFLRNYGARVQGVASRTEEPDDTTLTSGLNSSLFDRGRHTVGFDGERFGGHAVYGALDRSGRHWNAEAEYFEFSPAFRTDNGFTTRNGFRQGDLWTGLSFQPNRALLIEWEPSIALARVWDTEGRFKEEWIRPSVEFQLKRQIGIGLEYRTGRERFRNEIFDRLWQVGLSLSSRWNEMLGGDLEVIPGRSIWRTFEGKPVAGRSLDVYAGATVKPTQRLVLQPSYSYARLLEPVGGGEIFGGYILRTRLNYQFTRELSSRVVVEYDHFDRKMGIEPLVTYRLNPFTLVYVGVSGRVNRFEPETTPVGSGDGADRGDTWKLSSRQVFAKLQYLFRI